MHGRADLPSPPDVTTTGVGTTESWHGYGRWRDRRDLSTVHRRLSRTTARVALDLDLASRQTARRHALNFDCAQYLVAAATVDHAAPLLLTCSSDTMLPTCPRYLNLVQLGTSNCLGHPLSGLSLFCCARSGRVRAGIGRYGRIADRAARICRR